MKTRSNLSKYLRHAAIAGIVLSAGPLLADNLLFIDTFNRPDSTTTDGTGLNEAEDGKSGVLGALTWTGTTELNLTGNIVDINGERLRMDADGSNGNDGGFAYISDHNFIDPSIKSSGSFTVSVDIVSTSSGGNGRHIGFGVGSSLAELDAVSSVSTGANPSDVYFYYDNVGADVGLRILHGGVAQGGLITFPPGSPTAPVTPDTLSATFEFADMNAGSTLNYELFLNGISVVIGSTLWSGTDENYLCLASNHSNPSFLDNFRVSQAGPPVLIATDPADDANNIEPSRSLIATFDEEVQLGTTGSITIKNLSTSTNTEISVSGVDPDGSLSVIGNELTIVSMTGLGVAGDEIVVEISGDAIKDVEDDFFAGILGTDDPNWSFTIDDVPPAPDYLHPIPSTNRTPLDGSLFIAFDDVPIVGNGNLMLYRADGTLVETIGIPSSNAFVSDNRVTITPTVPLAFSTSYYVLIDGGIFSDALGNVYSGISDSAEWAFSTISSEASLLFGDSFNRPDGTDLNASSSGKYGSLGALDYRSVFIGVANVELSSGQLLLQPNENNGNSGALVYMDHNFTDAAIATAGGFSVTVDINAYRTGGTARYMSVAMGQSSAELDTQTTASASSSVAGDLVIGYRDNNNTLVVFENGSSTITSDLPTPPTRMRIDCSLSDFTVGSTVGYEVFFDDSATPFTSGSFSWSGTDENFISLSSNLVDTLELGVRNSLFDNLQIRLLGVSVGGGFAVWQSANNTVGGLDEDHDSDGVCNGIEYFLFGSANSTGFTVLPEVTKGGTNSIAWTQAADYGGNYGTDFVVEVSERLTVGSWSPVAITGTPDMANTVFINGNDVTYTFPGGMKRFARLRVSGP